jgi:hypothetical protein
VAFLARVIPTVRFSKPPGPHGGLYPVVLRHV